MSKARNRVASGERPVVAGGTLESGGVAYPYKPYPHSTDPIRISLLRCGGGALHWMQLRVDDGEPRLERFTAAAGDSRVQFLATDSAAKAVVAGR